MGKVKNQTINLTGVYIACQLCDAVLKFIDGALIVNGVVVITPGTHPQEYKVTAHNPPCEALNGL